MAEKVLVFIDAPNLNAMQTTMLRAFDHRRLRELVVGDRDVVDVLYYDRADKGSWHAFLRSAGYNIMLTPSPEIDVDDQLVADIYKMFNKADVIVYVGGDHIAHASLLQAKNEGRTIEVFCVKTMLAAAVRECADTVVELEKVIDQIVDWPNTSRRFPTPGASSNTPIVMSDDSPAEAIIQTLAGLIRAGKSATLVAEGTDILIRVRIV